MKAAIILLSVCLFAVACTGDEVDYGLGAYEEQLAELQLAGNEAHFLLDDGRLLYDKQITVSTDMKDSTRLYLNFSYLSENTSSPTPDVRINWMQNLGIRELQTIDSTARKALPDDPIYFTSVWLGRHYLNLKFDIDYNSQPHKIYLVADSAKLNDKELHLYFRHDRDNDASGSRTSVLASFSLKRLLGAPAGDRPLKLHINSRNYGDKTYELNY